MEQEFAFRNGMEVFGSDGSKVGKIVEIEASYIVVEKGFFFPSDHFIPTSAVSMVGADEKVYLSVTKEAALNQGWDNLPETAVDDREVTTPMMADGGLGTATGPGPTAAGYDTTSDSSMEGFISDQTRHDTAGAMMPEAENPTSFAGDPAYRDTDRVISTGEDRMLQVPVTEERSTADRVVQTRRRAGEGGKNQARDFVESDRDTAAETGREADR